MSLLDKLTAPFIRKTENGIAYYRFANRSLACPITSQHAVAEVRNLVLAMYGVLGVMILGGVAFASALTLIIAMSESSMMQGATRGFDLHWLYLAEFGQLLLILIAVLVFDGIILRVLRRQS